MKSAAIRRQFWACGLWGLVLLAGCRSAAIFEREAIAKVNGEVIPVTAFVRELQGYQPSGTQGTSDTQAWLTVKQKVLDQLIEQKLLAQEAKAKKIHIAPAMESQHIDAVRKGFTGAEFARLLQQQNMKETEWIEMEKERLMVQALYEDQVGRNVHITPEMVETYYHAHQGDFKTPDQVHVRQIVFETEAEAHNVLKMLRQDHAKSDFAALARKYSRSPDAENGGDIGFYSRGQLPEVFDRVFDLPEGKISEVISSEYGFHIFQMLERRPAHQQTLEEASSHIQQLLHQEMEQAVYEKWLKSLIAKAKIVKNEDLLQKIRL